MAAARDHATWAFSDECGKFDGLKESYGAASKPAGKSDLFSQFSTHASFSSIHFPFRFAASNN